MEKVSFEDSGKLLRILDTVENGPLAAWINVSGTVPNSNIKPEVAFKNIKGYAVNTAITVTYTATVNENATIGGSGNKNETDVTYSNNPNDSSNGNPSENPKPGQDTPTGTSGKDTTLTFVAELDLTKYKDSVAEGNKLAGATFTLTGTSTIVKGKGSDIFVEDV